MSQFRVFLGQPFDATIGGWVEITEDATIETITAEAKKLCGEEWIIADAEGFNGLSASYWDLPKLLQWVRLSDDTALALASSDPLNVLGRKDEEIRESAQENHIETFWGIFGEEDLNRHIGESLMSDAVDDLPEWAQQYFDYESYGRDAVLGGAVFTVEFNGDTYLFRNP